MCEEEGDLHKMSVHAETLGNWNILQPASHKSVYMYIVHVYVRVQSDYPTLLHLHAYLHVYTCM